MDHKPGNVHTIKQHSSPTLLLQILLDPCKDPAHLVLIVQYKGSGIAEQLHKFQRIHSDSHRSLHKVDEILNLSHFNFPGKNFSRKDVLNNLDVTVPLPKLGYLATSNTRTVQYPLSGRKPTLPSQNLWPPWSPKSSAPHQ